MHASLLISPYADAHLITRAFVGLDRELGGLAGGPGPFFTSHFSSKGSEQGYIYLSPIPSLKCNEMVNQVL